MIYLLFIFYYYIMMNYNYTPRYTIFFLYYLLPPPSSPLPSFLLLLLFPYPTTRGERRAFTPTAESAVRSLLWRLREYQAYHYGSVNSLCSIFAGIILQTVQLKNITKTVKLSSICRYGFLGSSNEKLYETSKHNFRRGPFS